jgi:hypothetical protein
VLRGIGIRECRGNVRVEKIERAKDPAIVAGEREGELGPYGEKKKVATGESRILKSRKALRSPRAKR